jgi:hypothetical protein
MSAIGQEDLDFVHLVISTWGPLNVLSWSDSYDGPDGWAFRGEVMSEEMVAKPLMEVADGLGMYGVLRKLKAPASRSAILALLRIELEAYGVA